MEQLNWSKLLTKITCYSYHHITFPQFPQFPYVHTSLTLLQTINWATNMTNQSIKCDFIIPYRIWFRNVSPSVGLRKLSTRFMNRTYCVYIYIDMLKNIIIECYADITLRGLSIHYPDPNWSPKKGFLPRLK